jgi:hypothetical protein
MARKSERIAQDQVLAIVEQAVALERHRIENMPAGQIDSVGGGFDVPTSPYPAPTPTNTGGAVMPNLPGLPTLPLQLPSMLDGI